jgi:hypothetical protein
MIREFATPSIGRIITHEMKEIKYYLSKYNGKDECYISVYKFEDESFLFSSAIIDKIFIDLDPKDDVDRLMSDFINLHEYLLSCEYLHYINFSGGGFHFFIPVHNCYSLNALYVGTMNIINEADVHDSIDPSVIGDYRQVARIPYTWNVKRQRFCIPVNKVVNDYNYYSNKAKKFPKKNGAVYFGSLIYDVDKYNGNYYEENKYNIKLPKAENVKDVKDVNEVLREYGYTIDDFNSYTRRFMSNREMNYFQRGDLLIFLKNHVFLPKWSPELVEEDKMNMLKLMKAILSSKKFKHFLKRKELKYIFRWNYGDRNKELGFK